MTATLSADALQDEVAISLASALAAANRRAQEVGLKETDKLLNISYRNVEGDNVWEVTYGPLSTFNRRGGGLIVQVNTEDNSILRVMRGQ